MAKHSQAKVQKGRLIILAMLLAAVWILLEVNLFRIQILDNDIYESLASRQYLKRITLPASRGAVYDRLGNQMVSNTLHYDIAADPLIVKDKARLAKACSKAFHEPEQYFTAKLNKSSRFTYLARRVPDRDIREILALREPGLIKAENFRREYPYRTYAAHLLGFTDPDDIGLSGLELQYDEQLRGQEGEAVLQYDGPRRVFYNADNPIRRPVHGSDIHLTIDKNIQTVVEQELAEGVKKARAAAGMAIIMDPFSGAVLAMVNYPVFDPNNQQDYKASVKRNRTITDVFEPGSTIKTITSAAILQEQLKKEQDIVYCEQGKYKLYDEYFHDTKKYGWLSFKNAVAKSSNIGMIKLSDSLPSNTFFRYLRNFGFGTETGVGLSGETAGILENPQKWSGMSKASISIGYGIGVTTIQLAAAYSAVVNGGFLYRPFMVNHLKTSSGKIFNVTQSHIVRQIISQEVSDQLKDFMLVAVEDGTGINAKVNGIKIGGKTGTARKMDSKTGKYSSDKYIASFVGFAPYDRPRYVLAIVLDEPKSNHYGGQVAAPVFSKIIHRIIHLKKDKPPDEKAPQRRQEILVQKIQDLPPVEGFRVDNALTMLDAKELKYRLNGKGQYIESVTVKDGLIILECGTPTIHQKKVPKLVGLTLREAIKKINLEHFRIELQGAGSGIVRKQKPPPGRQIKQRTTLTLVCR